MKSQRTPRLSLDLLRGFRAAARHLSFTHAAHELCVTQSAVSREIKALEEQLSTPLFTRVNRTLRLTPVGEQLYRAANEALELIDSTVEQVMGAGRALCVTATVPFASLWLGPRLSRFTRLHPEISLRVIASNDRLDMAREHIDIAIRHITSGATPPLQDKIFDYEIFPVCSPALLRGSTPIRTPADLANHVLLDLDTVRNGRPWHDWPLWFNAMKMRRVKPAGSLQFSHYDQVIEAAIAGSGIAIGRWPHLASHLATGVLVSALSDAGVARHGGFYVVVEDDAPPEPIQAFIAWLRCEADDDTKGRSRPTATRERAKKVSSRAAASRKQTLLL
jgi:LysR family glycine cleavage system transcriptional activator